MARIVTARLALVLACLLLVFLLALQVFIEGPVTQLDLELTRWLAAHRQVEVTRLMLFVSAAHQTAKVLAFTALLAAWLAIRRNWSLLPRLLVVPTGMLLNAELKLVFLRPRPHLDEPLVQLVTQSFPSGHAVAATVFYGAACALVFAHTRSRLARALAAGLAVAMVLLVCASRVYLGAHYLSDVVAGVAVGTICLAFFLARRPSAAPR